MKGLRAAAVAAVLVSGVNFATPTGYCMGPYVHAGNDGLTGNACDVASPDNCGARFPVVLCDSRSIEFAVCGHGLTVVVAANVTV